MSLVIASIAAVVSVAALYVAFLSRTRRDRRWQISMAQHCAYQNLAIEYIQQGQWDHAEHWQIRLLNHERNMESDA